MAGDVHHLATPASKPPTTAVLCRAINELWAAYDLDGVSVAAAALLAKLAPQARVKCYHTDAPEELAESGTFIARVKLSEQESLQISAPLDGDDARTLIETAAEMIDARVRALAHRNQLSDSVKQLARAERLQRALYAIADQASAVGSNL
ncbi:MAG: hypothetical protein ACRETC_11365, partial [Gammaproteobacteria bacterium]